MFLEKVFEAHFFLTACLKVAKSFIFYMQQTKKPLNMTPNALYSHDPLVAREYLYHIFPNTTGKRAVSSLRTYKNHFHWFNIFSGPVTKCKTQPITSRLLKVKWRHCIALLFSDP